MQALRTATHALHQLLDSQLPLARPGAGVAEYLNHLRVLRGWLQALAPLLPADGWGQGYLQAVDADLPPHEAVAAVSAGALPAPDAAFSLGVAYVVEGAQLGGQVLLRRLRESGVDHAMTYLQGRGADTGAHWGAFLKVLRARLAGTEDIASACRGACWAFEDLLERFRRLGLVE